MNIYREEQTMEGPFSIPRYNLSLSTCIQNMNSLCYTVVEIPLTKNMERKKKAQRQGRTNGRKLILNPTKQLVIVNLYIKYEVTIFNSFGDIIDEKVLQDYRRMDGRKDGQTEGQTDVNQYRIPPTFSKQGYK